MFQYVKSGTCHASYNRIKVMCIIKIKLIVNAVKHMKQQVFDILK